MASLKLTVSIVALLYAIAVLAAAMVKRRRFATGPGAAALGTGLVIAGCTLLAAREVMAAEPRFAWPLLFAVGLFAGAACLCLWTIAALRSSAVLRVHVTPATELQFRFDGPYRHVRHPLYAATLCAMAAAWFAAPGLPTATLALVVFLIVRQAARSEESKWLRSPHALTHLRYCDETGRFLPVRFGESTSISAPSGRPAEPMRIAASLGRVPHGYEHPT